MRATTQVTAGFHAANKQVARPHAYRQQGSALLITLIIITFLAVAAASALKSTNTESTLSRNEQLRIDAQQRAQSLLDSTTAENANFVVRGLAGETNCFNVQNCDASTVSVDSSLIAGADNARSSIKIERQFPSFTAPPRSMSSSAGMFQVARFKVEANYNGSDALRGSATVGHTVIVMTVKGAQ